MKIKWLQRDSNGTATGLQSVDSLWNVHVTWQEHTVQPKKMFIYSKV